MSVFNEIQESGLNQVLSRRLDIKGSTPSPSLVPEVAPSVVLENDRPEWGYLKGEFPMGRLIQVNAVAAQYGMVFLTNPVGSGQLLVVTALVAATANIMAVARTSILGGGIVGAVGATSGSRDFRRPATTGTGQLSTATNIATPSTSVQLGQLGVNGQEFTQPIILSPGTELTIYNTTVNQNCFVGIYWTERVAALSELG